LRIIPFIAFRYLFSKKKKNIINIISIISTIGISIGTMALIIVLSVFNGFDGLIKNLYSSFDPDLKILPVKGKTFIPDSSFLKIKNDARIISFAQVVEDNALVKNGNRQKPAVIKGVDNEFVKHSGIDSMIVDGQFIIKHKQQDYAVMGYSFGMQLGVGLNFINPIKIYAPKRKLKGYNITKNPFNIKHIYPTGFFMIQQDFDSQYMMVPIDFARKLFDYKDEISHIEIRAKKGTDIEKLKTDIHTIIGDKFNIQNRYEQHQLLYKMMKTEKLAIFFILVFILIIASFNIIGSLSMLIIDKKHDISILKSMGASEKLIQHIFLFEGWCISIFGGLIGMSLGLLICWSQIKFGLISLASGTDFVTNSYPVIIKLSDIIYSLGAVILIGYIASRFPVRYISSNILKNK
jgi:lipoprotein-releasing system permease protein